VVVQVEQCYVTAVLCPNSQIEIAVKTPRQYGRFINH
jgi:hypothetical protein